METKNLMEINSVNIGSMDTISEYQRLQINNKIGEYLQSHSLNSKKFISLSIKRTPLIDIWGILEKNFEIYQIFEDRVLIIDDNFIAEIWINFQSSFVGLGVNISSSNSDKCNKSIELLKDILKEYLVVKKPIGYTVIQYDNGNLITTAYKDIIDVDFNPLAVPFINNVDEYIQKFIKSNAQVLILYGDAGTGKSTFTKHLISKMQEYILNEIKEPNFDVLYSFDENIFYAPEFFKQLMYDDYDLIILEDFNQSIHKNSDEQGGLNPLHKLLSLTDGVLAKKRKFIITTNIESASQLHPALIRPGRCFDTVQFRNLEGVEIDDLCDSCAKNLDLQIESINISEFYAKCNGEQNSSIVNSKIGF